MPGKATGRAMRTRREKRKELQVHETEGFGSEVPQGSHNFVSLGLPSAAGVGAVTGSSSFLMLVKRQKGNHMSFFILTRTTSISAAVIVHFRSSACIKQC